MTVQAVLVEDLQLVISDIAQELFGGGLSRKLIPPFFRILIKPMPWLASARRTPTRLAVAIPILASAIPRLASSENHEI